MRRKYFKKLVKHEANQKLLCTRVNGCSALLDIFYTAWKNVTSNDVYFWRFVLIMTYFYSSLFFFPRNGKNIKYPLYG